MLDSQWMYKYQTNAEGKLMTYKQPMKIWMELPKVETLEEADAYCKLANTMLRKLGVDRDPFYASEHKRANTFYNFSNGPTFSELSERGVWMNLEFLAESPEEQKANP